MSQCSLSAFFSSRSERGIPVALARLTLPWGPQVDHVRLALMPYGPITTLTKDCKVTLLIESVGKTIWELTYMFGTVTIDGIDHKLPEPGGVCGCFTLSAGSILPLNIELGKFITAAGIHNVSNKAAGTVTNTLALTVVQATLSE